ncbi:MAG TPA: methionine adenosyltransferase [Candidatus Norongarragalinales archaeon]|nr:methionine adenosyltransferase [Candidatus Norongarragalinales archaeon]
MSRNISVERALHEMGNVEIVERKGTGHPDSLCDGVAEGVSVALCKEYLKECGVILHHNTDKVLLNAGEAEAQYGGGKILKPIYLVLSGNATYKTQDFEIDVPIIAIKAAKEHMKGALRYIDIEDGLVVDSRISPGSADLVDIFKRKGKKSSNDTSFGCGYAPFSKIEEKVMKIEKHLNSQEFKRKVPACGEDIKVMGLREGSKHKVTIACAIVARHVSGLSDYKEAIAKITEEAHKTIGDHETEIQVNTGDNYEKNSVYITAIGTSAEAGDPGSVGRGNRVNGLITPFRPMSLEAAAGKNPVTHIGKIYNVASFYFANEIVKQFPEVKGCEIYLLSQIGHPVDQPKMADIRIRTDLQGPDFDRMRSGIRDLVDHKLENISEITKLIIDKRLPVY